MNSEQPHDAIERIRFYDSPIPMWVFDIQTFEFLEVNDAAVSRYGYSRTEFLNMTILDVRPVEEIPDLLKEELRDRRHDSLNEVWTHCSKDGTLMKVEISTQRIRYKGREAELVIVLPSKPVGATPKQP